MKVKKHIRDEVRRKEEEKEGQREWKEERKGGELYGDKGKRRRDGLSEKGRE